MAEAQHEQDYEVDYDKAPTAHQYVSICHRSHNKP